MSPITELIGGAKAYGWGSFAAVGDFESIATYSVGSGGAANVEFTNIPSTYTHLQIRGLLKFAGTGDINVRVGNGSVDTGSNYAYHSLYGTGSSALALATTSTNYGGYAGYYINTADTFAGFVLDILDYANTNKFKTMRTLEGVDTNGGGIVMFSSSLWQSTSTIDTIRIYSKDSVNLAQYSHFALYGIKGAA